MALYLGIDYGKKRVGTALSDERGRIAFPHAEIPNDEKLLHELKQIIIDKKVDHVVVGDTRASGGARNPVTAEAEGFIAALEKASGKSVKKVPEVWSSMEASRYAPKGQEHDNAAAAAFILQRYLDMNASAIG